MPRAVFKSRFWWKGRRFRPSPYPQEYPKGMPLPKSAMPTKEAAAEPPKEKPEPVALSELARREGSEVEQPPDGEAVLKQKAKPSG